MIQIIKSNGRSIGNGSIAIIDKNGKTKQVGGGGSAAWGDITGTLSDQTDLQAALDEKLSSNVVAYSAQNKDNATILSGMVVAQDSSGSGVVRANASVNGKYGVGIMLSDTLPGLSGLVMTVGNITLTDWTAITGSENLDIRSKYYLDVVSGKITKTPSSISGNISQRVGVAVSRTTMEINFGYTILL